MANFNKGDSMDLSKINMFTGFQPIQYFPQYPVPAYNYMPYPIYAPQAPIKLDETCLYELNGSIILRHRIGNEMPSLAFSKFINYVIDSIQLKDLAMAHKKISIPGMVLLEYLMKYFNGSKDAGTAENFDDVINVDMIANLLADPTETEDNICLSTMRINIDTTSIVVCPNLIAVQKDFSYDTEKIKILDFLKCIRNSFEDTLSTDSIRPGYAAIRNYNRRKLIDSIITYSMQHNLNPTSKAIKISFDTYFENLSPENRCLFIDRFDSVNDFTNAL